VVRVIGVLGSVLDGVLSIPYLVAGLIVDSINGWLLLLVGAASAAIAILPGFPSLPELPGEWGSAVSWFLPLGTMLGIFTAFIGLWVAWWAISYLLRWAKFIG
jgi:hypothetical protein